MEIFGELKQNLECELKYHVILPFFGYLGKYKVTLEKSLREPLVRSGCKIIDFRIEETHTHLIIETPTIYSIEEVVRDIKEHTSITVMDVHNEGLTCKVWYQYYYIAPIDADLTFDLEKWHEATQEPRQRENSVKK